MRKHICEDEMCSTKPRCTQEDSMNCYINKSYDKIRIKQKKPICLHCGKPMKNYTPKKGKFKGQLQEYSWVCDCKGFPKNLVLGIG
jgi:hypothetical protein